MYTMANVLKHLLVLMLINLISDVKTDCVLSLKHDFGSPGPVLIRNGRYLEPEVGGDFKFRRSETVLVACPGDRQRVILNNETSGYDAIEAHCIINSTFRVDRKILQFKNIRCKSQPFFTTEKTNGTCASESELYGVGYKIKNVFYPLYSACFDKNLLHTHYVRHQLSPKSIYMQTGLKRPKFVEGDLFDKVSISSIYKLNNQKSRLDVILGTNMGDKYLSQNQALTRGHLAARADYTTSAETRATFHYVNTAPQWKRGNAGDWAALEDALRRRVQAYGSEILVFTGAHGVMTLPDKRDRMKEIYLHTDANNNEQLPVPMYFYKVYLFYI
nr:dsRNase2 [Hyphantria cunea]